MSFRRHYRRYRTLWVSLMACAGFLALAVFGWGVSWEDMVTRTGVAALLLLGLIVTAACLGYVLFKVRRWLDR